MAEKRILLDFPKETVNKPITYHLIKDFDLVVNIFKAKVDVNEKGHLGIAVKGSEEKIEKAISFLRGQGIAVSPLGKGIVFNAEKCVHCSACTGICPTNALALDRNTFKVSFNDEKCIECELCIDACPFRALSSKK